MTPIDIAGARALAEAYVRAPSIQVYPVSPTPGDLGILDEHTIEGPFGWVFFYGWPPDSPQSREPSMALTGNAPLLVTREGTVHVTGTAHPIEWYIANFERTGRTHPDPAPLTGRCT